VTNGLGLCGFLFVINEDCGYIYMYLRGYRDTASKILGHEFDLLGSCDVTGHMTVGSAYPKYPTLDPK